MTLLHRTRWAMALYVIGLMLVWQMAFESAPPPQFLSMGVLCSLGTLNDIRLG